MEALQCPGDPGQLADAAVPLKPVTLALGTGVVPVMGTSDENR